MAKPIAELRQEYARGALNRASTDPNPLRQFQRWLDEAIAAELPEPNAMTLATVNKDGSPAARVVLLKGLDGGGLVFFTNYASAKGQQLAGDPRAALVFLWKELERQVRVEGRVAKLSRLESEDYFRTRPLGSRLGALASHQSQVVASRRVLEERFAELGKQYADGNIPMPENWGGYRLNPVMLEFWQGRHNRLHDRLRYRLQETDTWMIERLEP